MGQIKSLLFLFVFTALFNTTAFTENYYESFENGIIPSSWKVFDEDNDGSSWTISEDSPYNGNYVLSMSPSPQNIEESDDWLITPLLNVAEDDSLIFYLKPKQSLFPYEKIRILWTENESEDFESYTVLDEITQLSPEWSEYKYSLNIISGKTVHIALQYAQYDGFGLYADYFTLPENISSEEYLLEIYPTEVDFGSVIVNNSQTENIVFNNLGIRNIIIQNIQIDNGVYSIEHSNLPIGIPPNNQDTIKVTVTPTPESVGEIQPITAELNIVHNADNLELPFPVTLKTTVLPEQIIHNFSVNTENIVSYYGHPTVKGKVFLNADAEYLVHITEGGNNSDLQAEIDNELIISPLAYKIVPDSTGEYDITVFHNDPNREYVSISILTNSVIPIYNIPFSEEENLNANNNGNFTDFYLLNSENIQTVQMKIASESLDIVAYLYDLTNDSLLHYYDTKTKDNINDILSFDSDKQILLMTSPYFQGGQGIGSYTCSMSEYIEITSISDIEANSAEGIPELLNQKVNIKGQIGYIGNEYISFFSKNSDVIVKSSNISQYQPGDSLLLKSCLVSFENGLTFLDSIQSAELLGNDLEEHDPVELSISEINESNEASFVLIRDVLIADPENWNTNIDESGNFKVVISDGLSQIDVKIPSISQITEQYPNPPTHLINMQGIVLQNDADSPYFEGYYLFLVNSSDIETININYNVPENFAVTNFTPDEIRLEWAEINNNYMEYYKIYRGQTNENLNFLAKAETSLYYDLNIQTDTVYYYTISAVYSDSIESISSDTLSTYGVPLVADLSTDFELEDNSLPHFWKTAYSEDDIKPSSEDDNTVWNIRDTSNTSNDLIFQGEKALTAINNNIFENGYYWLITPFVETLPGTKIGFRLNFSDNTIFKLKILSNSIWYDLKEYTQDDFCDYSEQEIISLNTYANQDVRLAFIVKQDVTDFSIGIDNFKFGTFVDIEDIDENEMVNSFQIEISNFPNPYKLSDMITLDVKSLDNTLILSIYDINGRQKGCFQTIPIKKGKISFNLPIENEAALPSGIYIYKIQYGMEKHVGKFTFIK